MSRARIPWEKIHYLEAKYDGITKVEAAGSQEDIRKLDEIILTLNPQCKSDNNIEHYVNLGFNFKEIEEELGVGWKRIEAVVKERCLKIKPKFRYLLVDPYGCQFFLSNLDNLEPFGKSSGSLKNRQQTLSKLGFDLYRFDNSWFDLDRGDNYMIKNNNNTIFVK